MQASTWICTYQMQATKFMSLLPLLVCSSCPRILILLIHVHDRTLISSPPLSSKDNSYLCSFLSPFVINDHKKGRSHMKFAMWRSMATTWSCTSCTCRVTTWIPLVGNHMKRLWFDTKSWTWVDGWVLNLHFWWTLSIWLKLTLLVTTCENMKIWNATCRILVGFLTLIPCSGAPPPMSKCLSIYLNLELFLMRVAFLIWIDHLKLRITCGTTIIALDLLEWKPLVWPCISFVEIQWYTFCWI